MKKGTDLKKRLVHFGFEAGLVFKGAHGMGEVVLGAALQFLSPERLNLMTKALTRHELREDPSDWLASLLIRLSGSYSVGVQHFASFYLLSHGLIKLVIIYLLWRKKLWAYPLSIAVIAAFVFYQVYRIAFTASVPFIILTVYDLIMIVLTYMEWQNLKKEAVRTEL